MEGIAIQINMIVRNRNNGDDAKKESL